MKTGLSNITVIGCCSQALSTEEALAHALLGQLFTSALADGFLYGTCRKIRQHEASTTNQPSLIFTYTTQQIQD